MALGDLAEGLLNLDSEAFSDPDTQSAAMREV